MRTLQAILALGTVVLCAYSCLVVLRVGPNLLPTYVAAVGGLGWEGQFTLDFTVYLVVSGLWVAWRHRFSGAGVLLGVLSALGGLCFFGPYLLWASTKSDSLEGLLLGAHPGPIIDS